MPMRTTFALLLKTWTEERWPQVHVYRCTCVTEFHQHVSMLLLWLKILQRIFPPLRSTQLEQPIKVITCDAFLTSFNRALLLN